MNTGENRSETSPIRVLHVHSSLAVRNGMLSVIENYRRFLDNEKVHFDYLYFFDLPDNRKEEIEAAGCRTFYLPFQNSKRPFREVEEFFAKHNGEFDILHCHPPFAPQVFARAAKRHGIKRIIAHSHSTKFSDKRMSAARNWALSRIVGFFATDYIACTDEARVLLGRHGKDAFILRNAIDCERFAFDADARKIVRADIGVGEGELLLGSVGRLAPEKNQAFMIDVLSELKQRGVSCKLAIAGSGNCDEQLRSRGRALDVDGDVVLLGNRADTPRLYSAYDVFLLTSTFEGMPVSAIEAQASGLPCLLSDVITEEAAIGCVRYAPLDEGAKLWADLVLSIYGRRMEPSTAKAQIIAASFDVRSEAKKLLDYYSSIIDDGRRSS